MKMNVGVPLTVLLMLMWFGIVAVVAADADAAVDDEEGAKKVEQCHPTFFECKNALCIRGSLRCNRVDDCGDNSDEADCVEVPVPTSCPKDEYLCRNPPMCISKEELCHDFSPCTDYDVIDSECATCQPHKMKCLNVTECVPEKYVCDGNKDCSDGSDELHCDDKQYKCNEEPDKYMCDDNSHCIFGHDFCDGLEMCDDGSDEKNNCHKQCEAKKCDSDQDCIPEGRGVKCVCRDGYKFDEYGKCIEHNYCNASDIDRPCSQTCVEGISGRGPQCRCLHGYELAQDGKSCNALGSEAILYVASASEIKQWSVKTKTYSSLVSGLKGVRGLALDMLGGRIFWSETDGVYSMEVDGGETTKIVIASFGLQKPEGLAYDFIAKNLYIVDSGIPAIHACELVQNNCVVVFNSTQVHSPKDIVLDPAHGLLYFTETGSGKAAIMRGSMDGKSLDVLVKVNVHRPISLDLDLTTNRLYWIDSFYFSGQVFKVDLDGTNRKPVLSHTVRSPSLLSIFEGNIYWVNGGTNTLMAANKFTGADSKNLFQNDHKVTALAMGHKSLQDDHIINKCHSKRCHVCLLNSNSGEYGSCFCARGHKASFNEQYCERVEAPAFLLASDTTQVLRLPLNTTGRPTVSQLKTGSGSMQDVNKLAYLPKSHGVLYSSRDSFSSYSIRMVQGIDGRTISSVKIVSGVSSVISIAADEASSIVFWTDYARRSIRVATLDGDFNTTLPINATLPGALCVDAAQGILYFSDMKSGGAGGASIRRCSLDGQSCSSLVSDRVHFPNHLLTEGQQLYWSDYALGEISTIDQWGNDRERLVITGESPLSFAIDSGILYWIEDQKTAIFYKHIHTEGGYEGSIETGATILEDLIAVVPHTLPQSACTYYNGGCEQICISVKRSLEVSCMCSEGFHLHQDKKSCVRNHPNCAGHMCPGEDRCLDQSLVCDDHYDCHDWSDENGCVKTCSGDEFKCANGQCISEDFKCDSDHDCNDGSDEDPDLCPSECDPENHVCDGDKCILKMYLCDQDPDCDDGSDELNCAYQNCDEDDGRFSCGDNECIDAGWVCDGFDDCDDGRDEKDCQEEACKDGEFSCNDGTCIDESEVCDHFENCWDGEDEKGCPAEEGECVGNEYACSDGECIHKSARCDGFEDCVGKEDEDGCDDLCGENEFQCENGQCISYDLHCDLKEDCGDGSDEKCDAIEIQTPAEVVPDNQEQQVVSVTSCQGFTCGSGRCIDADKRCDGKPDCVDNADEVNCQSSCKNTHVCQVCVDGPTGARCDCLPGYRLKADGVACEDVDECKDQNGGCSQKCVNKKGPGVKCQCFDGFERSHDYYSCKVRGSVGGSSSSSSNSISSGSSSSSNLVLYVSTSSGIKTVSSEGKHLDVSVVEATNKHFILKLEVEVRRSSVVYTSRKDSETTLYRMELGQQPIVLLRGYILDFALDWITGNVYVYHMHWPYHNSVILEHGVSVVKSISSSSNSSIRTVFEHTFPSSYMKDLVLHPPKGYMFYLQDRLKTITRASMDGTQRRRMTLASNHANRAVISILTVDMAADRLYWIHPALGQLKSVTVDDTNPFTFDLHTNSYSFRSIEVFGGQAYLTRNNSVLSYAFHKGAKKGVTPLIRLNLPKNVKVYNPLNQPMVPNPCDQKECMYMCVLSENGKASCLCPNRYLYSHRGLSCQGREVPHDVIIEEELAKNRKQTNSGVTAETRKKGQDLTTVPSASVHNEPTQQEPQQQHPHQPPPPPPHYTPKNKTLAFSPKCLLTCLNGGSCLVDEIDHQQSCSCLDEFEGRQCEKRRENQHQKTTGSDEDNDEGSSLAWVAGLVIGVALLVFLVAFALWYYKYKRHNESLMSSIRFKKQTKFVVCRQDDKEGLVPEISFGNPGFQEEIDEEAHMHENQDWWKRVMSRSRRSMDSAFHSKTSVMDDPLDDCGGRMGGGGDPQDNGGMSDKVRLLK